MSSQYENVTAQLRAEPRTWLVTGCAGFIGSNLLESLLKLDQNVVGLDNFATGYQRNFDEVRKRLQARGFEGRAPLVALSRMLGKPPGYLSTFVRGDGADYLTKADRQKLARFFRVDPSEFGDDGST